MVKFTQTAVVLLSIWSLQASAQLLSCSDINCPSSYGSANCGIDNTTFTMLGVAEFSSTLSPDPLTWTVGYSPKQFTHTADQRRFFLSTLKGLKLDSRTDLSGCALFFTGIEAGLSFVKPNGSTIDLGTVSGTGSDALRSQCVSDLKFQAQELIINSTSSGDLECTILAQTLQSSPPESCTEADTWGSIVAKRIIGPDIPSISLIGACNPTINSTYDVRSIATFSRVASEPFGYNITPLMTIFVSKGNATDVITAPEVHLECMKPMEDTIANQMVSTGAGYALTIGRPI